MASQSTVLHGQPDCGTMQPARLHVELQPPSATVVVQDLPSRRASPLVVQETSQERPGRQPAPRKWRGQPSAADRAILDLTKLRSEKHRIPLALADGEQQQHRTKVL